MKNLNRSKIVGVAAVSLAAVSLIGVGFASWIVGGITGTPTSGQVTVAVGEVTDNRITFGASGDDTAINFDCNAHKENPIKASYEGAKAPEDLSFSLKYSLSSTGNPNAENLPVNVTVTVELTGDFITFMGNNPTLVSLDEIPTGFRKSDSGYTYTKTVSTKTTDEAITFTFKWGSAFLKKNPAEITQAEFNDSSNGVTISSVLENLKTLRDAAKSKTITATISASVPA